MGRTVLFVGIAALLLAMQPADAQGSFFYLIRRASCISLHHTRNCIACIACTTLPRPTACALNASGQMRGIFSASRAGNGHSRCAPSARSHAPTSQLRAQSPPAPLRSSAAGYPMWCNIPRCLNVRRLYREAFTLHGLWVNYDTGKYPQFCTHDAFDADAVGTRPCTSSGCTDAWASAW